MYENNKSNNKNLNFYINILSIQDVLCKVTL